MQRNSFRGFLPELLLNTLFFFILSSVILQLLASGYLYEKQTALLNQAVTLCSDAANAYLEDESTLSGLAKHYPNAIHTNRQLIIYLNEDFLFCNRDIACYYLLVEEQEGSCIDISMYENGKDSIYTLRVNAP